MRSPTRRRAAVVLGIAVVLGLALQPLRPLPGTDAVGTVAYGVAAVGAVALLLPGRGARLAGAVGTAGAWTVELLQLTGLPARLADAVPPVALLLGRSFDPVDLALLLAGGLAAALALGAGSVASPDDGVGAVGSAPGVPRHRRP